MKHFWLFLCFVLFSLITNAQIRKDNVRNVFITNTGIYKVTNNNKHSSIYIPQKIIKNYKYITIRANKEHGTRVHILKKEPQKQKDSVLYSDYYKESILIRKGIELDIVIPQDARCIYILNGAGDNYKPDLINLNTLDSLSMGDVAETQNLSRRVVSISQKFMHWNIGNFSKGRTPYNNINKDNYKIRLDGFNNFINKYCPDCHYLLNEYNETFASVDGKPVSTPNVLFNNRKGYKVFPRSTSSGYNRLAIFWKKGLVRYKYGVFESLKGIKNKNGTLEYGLGYCISQYAVGGETLYVMSLHAPNGIKKEEQNILYDEILKLCSDYDNCILVGDFNRPSVTSFMVLSKAGFKILNDKSVTHPSNNPSGGYILDWVLYRCKSLNLSDFRVYSEAVDSNGELLSDHLPLSFTVTSEK